MRVIVSVKAGAKKISIRRVGESEFEVSVREPAREGAANLSVMEVVAGYFGVPKSSVRLIKGLRSRKKVLDITG